MYGRKGMKSRKNKINNAYSKRLMKNDRSKCLIKTELPRTIRSSRDCVRFELLRYLYDLSLRLLYIVIIENAEKQVFVLLLISKKSSYLYYSFPNNDLTSDENF